MKKKTVRKAKKVKTQYWANLYTIPGNDNAVMVQGNTFESKAVAKLNVYPGWVHVATKLIYSK